MKLENGYKFCLGLLALVLVAMFFAGCSGVNSRLDSMDGNPLYEIGKLGFHMKVREEASGLMVKHLDKHPDSSESLPLLSVAWDHFWNGDNPFDRIVFDEWIRSQGLKLGATPAEQQSLRAAADLLWQYFEVDGGGYVQLDERSRRIVDSMVAGLRQGYRDWMSQQK